MLNLNFRCGYGPSILMIAPPITSLSWLFSFYGATCITLSLGLGYGLSNLHSHDRAHCMPFSLYYMVLPVTLLVNTQPSFGYGLPLSIGLIDLFELSQLIDFGYSAYALPFIWAPPFLRFSRRKSSSSLFHPTLLTQELFISQLNLFF